VEDLAAIEVVEDHLMGPVEDLLLMVAAVLKEDLEAVLPVVALQVVLPDTVE